MTRLSLLIILLFAPLTAPAAELTFMDWFEPGDAAYTLLQSASRAAGKKDWASSLLDKGERLPQASARELAGDLEEDPRLDSKIRTELRAAFPTEVEAVLKSQSELQAGTDSLEARLKKVQEGLDELEHLRDMNTYNKSSSPTLHFGVSTKGWASDWNRYMIREQANMGANAYWEWQGAADGSSWRLRMEMHYRARDNDDGFYPSILGFVQNSAASFLFDNDFVSGLELSLGWKPVFFSTLIYSGASVWEAMPYFDGPAQPTLRLEAPAGNRETVGLYMRKTGQSKLWWPFQSSEFALAPSKNIYKSYSLEKSWELAGRLSLWGANLFLVNNATPFVAASYVSQNEANVNAYTAAGQTPEPPYHTRSYAVGLKGELLGGGTLDAEWAYSDWRRNDVQDSSQQDSALYLNASRNFGRLTTAVDYGVIGPKYITNTRGRSTGAPIDSSIENLQTGKPVVGWVTKSYSPAWLVNNTRRMGAQAAYKSYFGSLVASFSSSGQIEPSGPYVDIIPWIGNMPFNGADRYNLFGQNYYPSTIGASAAPTGYNQQLFDYNRRNEVQVNERNVQALGRWDFLQQNDTYTENRLLMGTVDSSGVVQARPDSVKYLNGLKLGLNLDFKALFETELPFGFSAFGEIRDTDEQGGLAKWSGGMISQRISEGSLSIGLNPEITLLFMGGYESLESRFTPFPIESSDVAAGTGFNFSLTRLLSGSWAELRYRILRHADSAVEDRSFNGWVFSAVCGVDY